MNSQEDPQPATKDLCSQDDSLLLRVDIPQYHSGTSTLMCAPADVSPNVMTTGIAKVEVHSYTHQSGKGSRVQKDAMNHTGNSAPQPPRHAPSHPVSKVSSPSVIKIEQPSNVYPSHFVYHVQGELKNLVAIGPFKNVSTVLNNMVGYAFPLKTQGENTNNARLELDRDAEHLHEISNIPAERKSMYPMKYAKGNMQYEQYLKHLNSDGKTGVLSNSAEVSTFQSSKCVDKKRHDRYYIYEKTSKYLSKVNANENLAGNDSTSACSSKKRNPKFLKNINDTRNDTHLVYGEVPSYHQQTLVKVCNLPSKSENSASDSAVMNVSDWQGNLLDGLEKRNNLSTQCRFNDQQFPTIYGPERNSSDRIHSSKEEPKKGKVAVHSDQQKRNSSDEKAELHRPLQLSNQYPVSEDADTSSVHTKYAPPISKEEVKGKRKGKKSSQPAKRSNESGEGKSEVMEMYKDAELVYFDLETGGLFIGVDILQIAAVSNGRSFMQYVTPTRHVNATAQDINGLKNENGTLMKRTSRIPLTWEPLETLPIEKSLKKFLDWLDATGPCFLVAHNASFDKRHLLHQVNMSGLYGEFEKRVFGFIDTLPFFRAMYPELKKPAGPGHRQVVLVKHVLQETYDAHDALADVKSLQKLVKKVDASLIDLLKHKLPF